MTKKFNDTLKDQKEQLAFLEACYKEIKRIRKESGTIDDLVEQMQDSIQLSDGTNFPQSFKKVGVKKGSSQEYDTLIRNYKINVLISIYNVVFLETQKNQPILLVPIFNNVKEKAYEEMCRYHTYSKTFVDEFHMEANTIMQTHRSVWTWLLGLFLRPHSEVFLRKHGFFESVQNPLVQKINEEDSDIKQIENLISKQYVNQQQYGTGLTPLMAVLSKANMTIEDKMKIIEKLEAVGAIADTATINSAIEQINQAGGGDTMKQWISLKLGDATLLESVTNSRSQITDDQLLLEIQSSLNSKKSNL
jgi:hypothetical protein